MNSVDARGTVAGEASAAPAPAALHPWWHGYLTRLVVTDVVAVGVAVFGAYVVRFDPAGGATVDGRLSPSYLLVSVLIMWLWVFALVAGRTQDRRLVGSGPEEYQRVASVTWRVFAAIAILAYLLRMEIGRGYLAIAFPLGLVLLLVGRFVWRQWLHRAWARGDGWKRILVVGHRGKVEMLLADLARRPGAGYRAVGVCLPAGEAADGRVGDVPVIGAVEQAAAMARELRVDAVAVVGSDKVTTHTVRQLGWDLEGSGIDLALAMSLTDVAGPRVIMQPVSGLPLVYVDEPRFTGPKYLLKSVVDWVSALLITAVLSPLLLAIAVTVKMSSAGPVLYRQSRVGVNGKAFQMLKFRSMVVGAHERLAEVLAAEGVEEVGLFYKPKNDPRVTRVGRVLRRYSLDELPQLLNVLRGEMSLVGPRPQIDAEVAQYDRHAGRRLLVKPGMTGLWQISGRNDVSPEEGIRMDVYYVENWSLFGDAIILARTARVLLSGEGAR